MDELIEQVRKEINVSIAPLAKIDDILYSLRQAVLEFELKRQNVLSEAKEIAKKAPLMIAKVHSRFRPPFRSYYCDDHDEELRSYYEEGEEIEFSMDCFGKYVFYSELEDGVIEIYYDHYKDYLSPPEFITY